MTPAPAAGLVCPTCGRQTLPMAYFGRGVNIAKMIALLPLSVIAPLIFLLMRKDRFICTFCRKLLPIEAHVPLLHAFSSDTALVPAGGPGELAIGEMDPRFLERKSQLHRMRAALSGVTSVGLLGAGTAVAISADTTAGLGPFLIMSSATGAISVFSALRTGKLRREAQVLRQRQRSLRVLALARQHAGRLNVTLVAAELQLEFAEAEKVLDAMIDGQRVDMDVDDSGRVTYVFPELMP